MSVAMESFALVLGGLIATLYLGTVIAVMVGSFRRS
jgi:hypothetical protein